MLRMTPAQARSHGLSVEKPKEAKADADGHCTVCGLEFEDPRVLTHQCPPGFQMEKPKRKRKPTVGVAPFELACIAAGLPRPFPEHRFDRMRKWRVDWAFIWPVCKSDWLLDYEYLALEVQGGNFAGGRHVRGAALLKEYEKLNALAIAGWHLMLIDRAAFDRGDAVELVSRFARSRGLLQ